MSSLNGNSSISPSSMSIPETRRVGSTTTEAADSQSLVTIMRRDGTVLDWDNYLKVFENLKYVPPVNYFKHAPLADIWDQVSAVSQMIEVPNVFLPLCRAGMLYWIATVKNHKGYKACIEYERFGMDSHYCAWISYCTRVPKPIGWCTQNKALLFPDAELRKKYPNFLDKMISLFEETGGFQTIPIEHASICGEKVMETRKVLLPNGESKMVEIGTILEVVDRTNLGLMRIAKVQAIVGDRVHVKYMGDNEEDTLGFWFSVNSDTVHLPGWSQNVGHPIKDINFKSPKLGELRDEHFPSTPPNVIIEKGMWLEVRHPVHFYFFIAAKIVKVLQYGYIMLKIERNLEEDIKICYHITSPLIFPVGFAQAHQLIFDPPYEANATSSEFSWTKFLANRNEKSLQFGNIPPSPLHEFKVGYKLEAIDLAQPSFLGPATIIKIVEHMLFIHFDKWPMIGKNCQWVEASSPHIYPIGWAELVGHKFEGSPAWPVEKILEEASEKNLI